jgi:hypothetical protein
LGEPEFQSLLEHAALTQVDENAEISLISPSFVF